jgi:uncharacterized protein DUF5995
MAAGDELEVVSALIEDRAVVIEHPRRRLPPRLPGVLDAMQERLDALPVDSSLRHFLATYRRTTVAVGEAIDDCAFEDSEWVDRWDAGFARLYLDALDAHLLGAPVPRPWRLAFEAPPDLHALRHVLLGINAHVNFDLPQALLGVIAVADFDDRYLLASRRRDHERIDGVLSSRVAAEDDELGSRSVLDRLLTPVNRLASKRFLREARRKVWHNTYELHAARVAGPDAYAARLAELEVLSAAKVADLLEPGQVLLRLAISGFGVTLPPL